MIASCGKKGDPEYEDSKKKAETRSSLIKKV